MTIKKIVFTNLLLVGLFTRLAGQSCDINGKKHFNYDDIKYILDKNHCNSCHFKGSYQSSWTYDTYADIFAKTTCETSLIVHGRSDKSLLIDKLNGGPTICGNAMPLGNKKISDIDLLAIESWIDSGAPEKCIPVFEEIKDVFTVSKCQSCHSGPNNWNFDSYLSMQSKTAQSICEEPILKKYMASESLLYKKIANAGVCGEPMLVNLQPMAEINVIKIRDWINAGAPESARVLPVNLSEFSTEIIKNKEIVIYWRTATETNTSHFELETSTDGIHFSYLTTILANNSSSAGSYYSYTYKDAVTGFNYFRLKINDFDQSFSFSPVRVERISNTDQIFKISPVPVNNNLPFNVEWYPIDGREKTRLLLLDMNGSLCRDFIINNGFNSLLLNEINPGVYYFSIKDYSDSYILKRVVVLD